MIKILGGSKTGYNLFKLFKTNNINTSFYFFPGEYGKGRKGGYPVSQIQQKDLTDNIIISSETAFVYFKTQLENNFSVHYFLRDKTNLSAIAKELKVNIIAEQSLDSLSYPAFIKPKQSGENIVPFKTKIINNEDELNILKPYLRNCSIQLYLDNKKYKQFSIAGYFTGSSKSLISVEQINQYPQGVSSYVRFFTSTLISELKNSITNYLNQKSFLGFIEMEFKINLINNEIYLMDINPRPWGWFYYYISAMQNFRNVILLNEEPIIDLKESWINIPRLIFSNLHGSFKNPSIKEVLANKICYEPFI